MSETKVIYEPEDDVLNIWLSEKPIDYADEVGEMIVHFTKEHEPVYLEILNATQFVQKINKSLPDQLKKQLVSP